VRATVPIAKGSTLFATYTYSLNGTNSRQIHLKDGKFFQCLCNRCKDPTELGTCFSALKCGKCIDGHVLPLEPLNLSSPWKCDSCSFNSSSQNIEHLLSAIQNEIDNTKSIEMLEKLLTKYGNLLHSNHFLLISIKSTLIELYGHVKDFSLSDELLKRKIDLCEDVLKILDIFEPGKSRSRGLVMSELQVSISLLSKRKLLQDQITQDEYEREILNGKQLVDESQEILSWEDQNLN
jgi:hypothetical protein